MGQQASSVLVYYMVAAGPGSLNEITFNALARKADTVAKILVSEQYLFNANRNQTEQCIR